MRYKTKQTGITLIVSMVMLLVLTLMVVSGVRGTTMNERMAGNSMERARAYQAAEQAIAQATAVLQTNGDSCLSGCTNTTLPSKGVGDLSNVLPTSWVATYALDATQASGQKSSAKYVINQLSSTFVPSAKSNCMPYSVMGRGVGLASTSVVILQTVAFVCPL